MMNIGIKEIKERFLLSFTKFVNYLGYDFDEFNIDNAEVCYCDLEEFFWNNNIHLHCLLNENIKGVALFSYDEYLTYKAYTMYEAFEILNNKLLKDK